MARTWFHHILACLLTLALVLTPAALCPCAAHAESGTTAATSACCPLMARLAATLPADPTDDPASPPCSHCDEITDRIAQIELRATLNPGQIGTDPDLPSFDTSAPLPFADAFIPDAYGQAFAPASLRRIDDPTPGLFALHILLLA